jgi:hypothetical protein
MSRLCETAKHLIPSKALEEDLHLAAVAPDLRDFAPAGLQ